MIWLTIIFGLIFGSFANVVLLRLNTGESLIYRGSRCFSCSRTLSWYELFPVFSYLALRGRCRTCKSKISLRYPLVEFGTAVLFLLIFIKIYGDFAGVVSIKYFLYFLFMLGAWYLLWLGAVYDLRHKILPDVFNYGALLSAFFATVFYPTVYNFKFFDILYGFLTSLAIFAFFFLLVVLSRGRWMGFGDAKYILAFGFIFRPISAAMAVVFSFWIGAVFGIFMLLFRKLKVKDEIPFGPFLFLGALVSFIFWEKILSWYLKFF